MPNKKIVYWPTTRPGIRAERRGNNPKAESVGAPQGKLLLPDAPEKASASVSRKVLVPYLLLAPACMLFIGCTTVQVASDRLAEKALEAAGIKLDNPTQLLPAKTVRVRLESSLDLNAGEDGQGLSTIFRMYKLKDQNAFMASPYAVFGNPEREKNAFGQDILEVKELVMSPGEVLDIKEKIPNESAYVGTVALYRLPRPHRWRFVFASSSLERSSMTLGLHACAMTATAAPPVGMTINESSLLSSARCK